MNGFVKSLFAELLARRGFEEIIGPLGPVFREQLGPHPEPWKVDVGPVVAQLVQAATAKVVTQGAFAKGESAASRAAPHNEHALAANKTIDILLDDWCGTPPRRHPWPWPGPPPWTWEIVSSLTTTAHAMQPGALRDELLDVAGKATALGTRAAGRSAA